MFVVLHDFLLFGLLGRTLSALTVFMWAGARADAVRPYRLRINNPPPTMPKSNPINKPTVTRLIIKPINRPSTIQRIMAKRRLASAFFC
jgi:hypothetical protein